MRPIRPSRPRVDGPLAATGPRGRRRSLPAHWPRSPRGVGRRRRRRPPSLARPMPERALSRRSPKTTPNAIKVSNAPATAPNSRGQARRAGDRPEPEREDDLHRRAVGRDEPEQHPQHEGRGDHVSIDPEIPDQGRLATPVRRGHGPRAPLVFVPDPLRIARGSSHLPFACRRPVLPESRSRDPTQFDPGTNRQKSAKARRQKQVYIRAKFDAPIPIGAIQDLGSLGFFGSVFRLLPSALIFFPDRRSQPPPPGRSQQEPEDLAVGLEDPSQPLRP